MKSVTLVDMDEVLVDFVGGALEAHGWSLGQLEAERPTGQWSIPEVMGLGLEEFWFPIHVQGAAFWENLQVHPWIHELIDLVEATSDEWYIVTSPSELTSSYVGKLNWLKGFFGDDWDRGIITRHKHLLANAHTTLIDDREENIVKFTEAGGKGLLFPTMGGSLHPFAHDPIQYLTPVLIGEVDAPLLR